MKEVFVDSSAWFHLIYEPAPEHRAATDALAGLRQPLVTTNLVVFETMSLLTKRAGRASAEHFGQAIRSANTARIVRLSADQEDRAWDYFFKYRDKDWDLVDCASFALMDELGLDTAFTFDDHFAQKGYRLIPVR